MFFLKESVHSKNVYNIYKDSNNICAVDMICCASSEVYSEQQSRYVNLNVKDFSQYVDEIETCVTTFFNKPLIFASTNEILPRVKIPCRYGHVTIPILNQYNGRATTFDVTTGVMLRVSMQAKSAWYTDTHCGISWVLHSIKIIDE